MNSIRVLLTDKCNQHCPNCLNRSIRTGSKYISYDNFQKLARYFHANGVHNIRLMGGEPTLHPVFDDIVKCSQSLFERVTVFTNGTCRQLQTFKPRSKDGINYNFNFSSNITEEMLLPNMPGNRVMSVVISNNYDTGSAINKLKRIIAFFPSIKVSLTFDCTANIFKDRDVLLKKFSTLYTFCLDNQTEVLIDHALPICFLYGTNIPSTRNFSICDNNCSGLIDPDCNLRYCNLDTNETYPLLYKGELKPYKLLENHLLSEYFKRQTIVLEKICKECPFYGDVCNGGCYIQNNNITRQDILQHTQLPLMK